MNDHFWHGGHSYFEEFAESKIGSGEGAALGWGFYFASNRDGGEYFARYMYSRDKRGFLYKTSFRLAPDEILNLDMPIGENDPYMRSKVSRIFRFSELKTGLHGAYLKLRQELGDEAAAKLLRAEGIMALKSHEETKPSHGETIVILDKTRVLIHDIFQLIIEPHAMQWKQL